MSYPREKKRPAVAPTADDEWAAATNEVCARAMARWLKETVNTQRPINTLKLDELKRLAEHVVCVYLVEASLRVNRAPTAEEKLRLVAFLA